MKRIWIAGCAGSGKTTLAKIMGGKLNIPVYHRDLITWDENDDVRTENEQIAILQDITKNDRWIFEGARFTASRIDGRMDKCDTIIHLELNRFLCAYRGIKRGYAQAKRTDILEKDKQPFHLNHIQGVLIGYPKKRKQRDAIFSLARENGINVIILKNQTDNNNFIASLT